MFINLVMPSSCAVSDCKNYKKWKSGGVSGSEGAEKLVFHRFPSDTVLSNRWRQLCRRKDAINPLTAVICSAHFRSEDYQRDMEHELLGLPSRKRRRLNPDAVPSVFPLRDSALINTCSDRSARMENRKRKLIVKELVDNPSPYYYFPENIENQENIEPPAAKRKKLDNETPGVKCQTEITKAGLASLEKKFARAQRLNAKKDKIIKEQRETISVQKGRISNLRMKLRSKKVTPQPVSSKRFKPRWSTLDTVRALQVRSNGSKAYKTARHVYKLPLPSISTLKRYSARFECSPGILTDVLVLLKSQAETMPEWKRVCAIYFDEMYLLSKTVYDKQQDAIVGNRRVQVVMLRGIFDNWKQPIYFEFDADMTKDNLFTIIQRVESAGFFVHAVTSDLGPKNRTLWTALGIDEEGEENCYFQNPACSERSIYVLADVPHMLKHLRNHLIDDGLRLPTGTIIDFAFLEDLADYNAGELKLCKNFNKKEHLHISKAERMRVRPAAQVFSHHVATLCKKFFPKWKDISDFFELMNNGFDICNSRTKFHAHKFKSAYSGTREQKRILNQLREMISAIRFLDEPYEEGKEEIRLKGMLPCQRGFIVSINSITGLFDDLKKMYDITMKMMTSRLNQDCLESFFSRIRGFGGPNSHPTSAEFKHRLRLILLGKVYKSPEGCNVDLEDEGDYLSAGLIQKNSLGSEVLTTARKSTTWISASEVGPNDKESLFYLAGYIAWTLKRKGKGTFGRVTRKPRSSSSWLSMLSRGRLITPTDEISDCVYKCNQHFLEFIKVHGKENNLSAKLMQFLQNHLPGANVDVLTEFIKLRISLHVKYANEMRKSSLSRINIKKAKQFAHSAM